MGTKGQKELGTTKDETFSWATQLDPNLEQWRSLAEEWLMTIKRSKERAMEVGAKFLQVYIHKEGMSTVPAELLRVDYPAKSFDETCLSNYKSSTHKQARLKLATRFIDWVLQNYFSVEDDNGIRYIPSEFHNPISPEITEGVVLRGRADESDKNTLPFRYIKQLRTILCLQDALHFKDWKWAQEAMNARNGGDWFVVDPSIVDTNDPDCVWRKRETSKYEQEKKGHPEVAYELWSPVRTVALYIKLLLPLRTYQVRMLDSGEADTYRYDQLKRHEAGLWTLNKGLLKEGSEKRPYRRGVFRQFNDRNIIMTGLYINTNKTADIDKDEWEKGYEVPWQYEEALYWMAKLRNWQERYNSIENPTSWTELERNHLGTIKDQSILKQMGTACFLFRDPATEGANKAKPIRQTGLEPLWYKLLLELQEQCAKTSEEKNLKFVKVKTRDTTYYPLHSLRVSLITAYALEGGVPMPILSKCIAGHARLVMTLYYTKAGITYVSEKMAEAEKRLAEQEQDSWFRWLKDAELKQLEAQCAYNDPISLQTVINAQQSGASFIKDDKGICPKAALGCDSGGVYVNDDSSKTSYGVVPGYPQQNCVRCRWFLTGPAFLPGLVHHFNVLSYEMGETAEQLNRYKQEAEELENMRFDCEQKGVPFLENEKLSKFEKLFQQKIEENDKLANNLNATLRLIDRCIAITKLPSNGNLQFVSVGTMEDVRFALNDAPNKLYQIQTVCNGATFFPETDYSKAVLQRSQVLDLALEMNGQRPVFFRLTPEQQLVAGNAWMQLLISRAGSLEDAVPYVEGRKKLTEIGLENETVELLQNMTGRTLQLPSIKYPNTLRMIGESSKEVANV